TAAALGGMAFALLPGVFQTWVPARWGEVPAVLFGLGAVGVARNPEGAVLHTGRQIGALLDRLLPTTGRGVAGTSPAPPPPVPLAEGGETSSAPSATTVPS
ncbi:MAG TPA: hypothetical protein VE991_14755, partial [Acidimicrobiales bacterium]|nr:hypothetical protein [Acidimicrobiales bacterium]